MASGWQVRGGLIERALVTGGSRGLGRCLVAELSKRGVEVVSVSRDPGTDSPGEGPGRVRHVAGDLSGEQFLDHLRSQLGEELARPQLLVNNAASGLIARFENTSEADLQRQLRLMLDHPALLMRQVYAQMRATGFGCIVNISSMSAVFPIPRMHGYNAAKAGLSALTASLEWEARRSGVRCIDFQPGELQTEFNERSRLMDSDPGTRKVASQLLQHGRRGKRVEEAAARLVELIENGRSGRYRYGPFFETILAPLAARLLPVRVLARFTQGYFGHPERHH